MEVVDLDELYNKIRMRNESGLPNDPKVTLQSLQDTFAVGVY